MPHFFAEDNRTNRFVIQKFLTDFSVELIEATNGRLAIDLCLEHQPDIILMDMSMPEIDGISATEVIRSLPMPQPYIIALTANAFQRDRDACLAAGMDAFLTKPIKKADLLQEIATLLARNAPSTDTVSVAL